MINNIPTSLEEQAALFHKLSQAPARLAELQQQQAEILRKEQQQAELERLTGLKDEAMAGFMTKRNEAAAKLQAWLDQGIQIAAELERLNREADATFRRTQSWAEAAVKTGAQAPPIMPGDYRGIAEDEIRRQTGYAQLMRLLPEPMDPAANHLAQALGWYCREKRGFSFGFTGPLLPTWKGVPPGAIE